jgi:hypothetical protein
VDVSASIAPAHSQKGARANIPPKRNRKAAICISPYLYRAMNMARAQTNRRSGDMSWE